MKHKHAELIKAWAEGAEIQFQYSHGEWDMASSPAWDYDKKYRIDPNCEYAIEKIRELGGDEVVEIYKYWLGGGIIQFLHAIEEVGSFLLVQEDFEEYFPINSVNDPFKNFSSSLLAGEKFRKKKQTVKQVLWAYYSKNGGDMSCPMLWVAEGENVQAGCWYFVPTCTREVEL